MFYNDLLVDLQTYMVKRDLAMLNAAIVKLERERDDPSLLEFVVEVPMPEQEFEALLQREGSYKARVGDVGLSENKLVRVITSTQPDDTCMIMRVAFFQNGVAVLVPIL